MSKLFDSANSMTTTTNGMDAYKDVGESVLSLFFKIGTSRGVDMTADFEKAYRSDPDKALRVLQWARDIRGGAGERQRYRDLLKAAVGIVSEQEMIALIRNTPEIGRYDDLHVLFGTQYGTIALQTHLDGVKAGNGLAAKWMPRKGAIANAVRQMWNVSPKFFRKELVNNTKVVEQLMCAGKWDEIVYSHIPSKAASVYADAFKKHDESRYVEYLGKVMTGEEKMHAAAIFPHDVYKACRSGQQDQANAQWKSLPNYLDGTDEKILVVSDVSGSMSGEPMAISVALGLYFSERLTGEFKDCVVTFSEKPSLVKLNSGATLSQRIDQLERIDWEMSTNLEAVFDLVLNTAKRFNLTASDLPTKIMIISDMQFNAACRGGTALEMIRQKYKDSGFEMPQLVFWNVNGRETGNAPAQFNEQGVGLVSGASPAVVKAVLGAEIDPIKVMLKAIMVDRYDLSKQG